MATTEQSPASAEPAVAHEVTAVRYGSLAATRGELYHRWSSYGEPDGEVEMAYYFWLLRAAGRTILVDTGFDPAAGERRGRTCLVEPLTALERLGVAAAEVDTVLVTHFHYDHVGNLGAFPDAELVVGATELEFWTGPLAARPQFAAHVEPEEIARIERAVAAGRVRTTRGAEQVLPGVRAIEVGGHSPGQLLVVVDAADGGRVVLTSDAVHFYEEIELDRPFGVVADLAAMYRAYDRVGELAREGTAVVAGHDPAVMERFAGPGEVAGLAVRVKGPKSGGEKR